MLDTLNVAQTGLTVSKTQVEGVMNNLANENTPGYKKRVVNTAELDHLDDRLTGRGAYVQDVTRVTNVYVYQNLIEEQSKQSAFDQLDVMLEDIESIFFETDDSGLSADVQRYFKSLENLRTSPNNEIYKNDLKNNAEALVINLQTLYENIEDLEDKSLSQSKEMVEDINRKLNSIGDLSQEIIDSVVVQNDLLDKRDQLEQELAEFIDIEIHRETNYELKIGGQTAVRFDTNVHALNIVENYSAQKDMYVKEGTLPYQSNLVDPATWNGANISSEVQTVKVTGNATSVVSFLGINIPNSATGDSTEDTIDKIVADAAFETDANPATTSTIISTWNTNNPNKEIASITKSATNELTITYKNTEGDIPDINESTSNGIAFEYSQETTKGKADIVTYKLNNEIEINVAYGETITNVAIGTDPETYEDITVDETNVVRALVHKINTNTHMLGKVTAYNGEYEVDKDGNKLLANNPDHSSYDSATPNKDRFLVIEATLDGEKGKFIGEVTVTDANATANTRSHVDKSSDFSKEAEDDIHLEIFDEKVELSSGKLDSILDNIQTNSGENKFSEYKQKLDNFAKALSDLSDAYIEVDSDTYVWGKDAVEINDKYAEKVEIGLFSGANVSSLKFNDEKVNTLTQDKLDYLSKIQWKEDIDFDGTGQNNTSFSKYYQTIRVEIADDRENVRFRKEAQDAVTESLHNTYDKLTKVDKDEEMVSLIKFQASYEANAKIITVVDEMLQTILGMKR